MEISAIPTINPTTNIGLYNYLHGISNDALFAQEVLKILMEELCTHPRERHNSNLTPNQDFKVGGIFKSHVQVQSNSNSGAVKKMRYQFLIPLKIIEDLGNN